MRNRPMRAVCQAWWPGTDEQPDREIHQMFEQVQTAADSVGLVIYGEDFLCRVLAIIYCYGGGPGGEYFRVSVGRCAAREAAKMLEKAVLKKDWKKIRRIKKNVNALRAGEPYWLANTLNKLNIPACELKQTECL